MLQQVMVFYTNPDQVSKMAVAFRSSIALGIFIIFFVVCYYKLFWKVEGAKRIFWISSTILAVVMLIKFSIGVLYKGYVPELLLFYGIPSPKAQSLGWWLVAVSVVMLFLYYREKIEAWPTRKFLPVIFITFSLLIFSVAAIREGKASVADPYTKIFWEYSGNVSHIRDLKVFLHNYIVNELPPLTIAKHSETHPPGYTVILYMLSKLFSVGFLGMAVLTIIISATVVWPLYYLWRELLPELAVRRALEIFIFVPSIVLMIATSTEGFFLLLVWTAVSLCLIGWKKNIWLAGLGGISAAMAVFSNFLFLLLAPFFLYLVWRVLHEAMFTSRLRMLTRIFVSLLSFSVFFVALYQWSGYSIVDNFYTARVGDALAVRSNFESLRMYLLYFFMNMSTFLFYSGIPLAYLILKNFRHTLQSKLWLFNSGLVLIVFFLLIGIFQGNVERLWLFMVPFFVVFFHSFFTEKGTKLLTPFLVLLLLQVVVTEILFYTFY
ncbi:MAG: hypothetical protein UT33_C0001G0025 [Candidatus Peregrinibacteria bacterium GW2011_GWC2_39_14]|nr:MAG: hypothetical protein UT33_C0001G0025 [Candidatus Peregrinibacteria bacterium GW2011_GWC2_39_14]